MNQDLIVTGIPFSGATLACTLLHRLPEVVAIDEPVALNELLDVDKSNFPYPSVIDYVEGIRYALMNRRTNAYRQNFHALFSRVPLRLRYPRPAPPDLDLTEIVSLDKQLPPTFTLAVKCMNLFAWGLPDLRRHFRCCVVVRNPLAILAAWRAQDNLLREGRVPEVEAVDPTLAKRLAAAKNHRERRLTLLDWYFDRLTDVSDEKHIQRYEDIVDSNGASLATVLPSARAIPSLPGVPLQDGNRKVQRDLNAAAKDFEELIERQDHACWKLYRPDEVNELLANPRLKSSASNALRVGASEGGRRDPYRPMVDFMIVGAQKCGTTALWEYIRAHPQVSMSTPKEVHLFSSPDYRVEWSPQEIDQRYARWFHQGAKTDVRGEVTPIYMFLTDVAPELKRYNPKLKLIVLLRDPVERTISDYYMQFARGKEKAPIWLALLAEPWRRWRCTDPRRKNSAFRIHSYRARSLYSLQLRNLYRHFPRDKVLVVSSHHLLKDYQAALRRVFSFLGISEIVVTPPHVAMSGDLHGRRRHPILSFFLRLSFLPEKWRARGLYKL